MKIQKWMLLLVLSTATANAQPEFKQSTRVVGQHPTSAKDIEATVMEFKDMVYACEPDGGNPGIVLQLRETNKTATSMYARGQLVYIDTQKSEIRWTRPVRYDEEMVQRYGDRLMVSSLYSCSPINMHTGADDWTSTVLPFCVIPRLNLMLGYKSGSAPGLYGAKLYCVDMATGKNRWDRSVGGNSGINDWLQPDDSTLLLMASGLHHININSGKGWDYQAKMVSTDYTRSILTSAAGIALGVLTGVYVYNLGGDVLSHQCSNLLKEASALYFASRDSVYKLDTSGKALWKTSLGRRASSSVLWMDSTQLYFLNLGMAEYNGTSVGKGTTWLAAYNKRSGQPKYCNFMGPQDLPVMGYSIKTDSLDIFLSDRCVRYALNNGAIRVSDFDTLSGGAIRSVVDAKRYYLQTESVFRSLYEQNQTGYWVETTRKNVVMLGVDFRRGQTVPISSLYTLKGTYQGYLLLTQGNKTVIADPNGKLVAELTVGSHVFTVGHQLYAVDKCTLSVVNLDTVLH